MGHGDNGNTKRVGAEVLGIRAGHRVAVIMDGTTVFYQSQDLSFGMDYASLLTYLDRVCDLDVNRALYFNSVPNDPEEYSPIRKLVDFLDHNGYRVHTKNADEGHDRAGRTGPRARNTVELAVEMITVADKVDTILLFAADPELVYAVERAQNIGARVVLVGNCKSVVERSVSEDLRRAADKFVELSDLRDAVALRDTNAASAPRRTPYVAPAGNAEPRSSSSRPVPVEAASASSPVPARSRGLLARPETRPDRSVVDVTTPPEEGEATVVSDRRPRPSGGMLDLSRSSR